MSDYSKKFIVVVTRGTAKNVPYCRPTDRDSADLIRADAVKMGYRNAKVVQAAERDFIESR